jgi:hypothetical protein
MLLQRHTDERPNFPGASGSLRSLPRTFTLCARHVESLRDVDRNFELGSRIDMHARNHAAVETAVLVSSLLPVTFGLRWLVRDLRTYPANFPDPKASP